ncbi:MAG: very short patch repair endonuclease [Candidatus Zambryskibacteria bacterium]|nr:very short patch repair endonuclease [Candidatus Zambryskibacteria bacterium]
MPDTFTKKKRSEIMSRIRAKNTKLENNFLKELSSVSHNAGYRYRKHYLGIIGKPDIAFPNKKLAVFIDGCFWHGCKLHSRVPLSNISYWKTKLERNCARDKEINRKIKKMGWRVIRIWEHEAKGMPDKVIAKVMHALRS